LTYFETLLNEVSTGHFNANYKLIVICKLSSSPNFTETKENLAIELSQNNKDKPHPYFMTHNTVFDVLSKRLGLVEKIDNSYKLAGKLTPDQVKEIKKACKSKMETMA